MLDFFLLLEAPFFFLALILLTSEFLTPSLLVFFAAFFLAVFFLAALRGVVFLAGFFRPGDFFAVAMIAFCIKQTNDVPLGMFRLIKHQPGKIKQQAGKTQSIPCINPDGRKFFRNVCVWLPGCNEPGFPRCFCYRNQVFFWTVFI